MHGTRTTNQNELWSLWSGRAENLVAFDKLRYRLMPYIYSLAWKTTSEGYTTMRPLVMDFRDDVRAQNIGDQFLFGPALLVNPVTEPGATTRHLYLPDAKWYDFWTGAAQSRAGILVDAASADRSHAALCSRWIHSSAWAGLEYAAEKSADPIELRVYRGANGDFTLYEDENDTYNYEKGAYATIPLSWDDATHTLTIGDRKGHFPACWRAALSASCLSARITAWVAA